MLSADALRTAVRHGSALGAVTPHPQEHDPRDIARGGPRGNPQTDGLNLRKNAWKKEVLTRYKVSISGCDFILRELDRECERMAHRGALEQTRRQERIHHHEDDSSLLGRQAGGDGAALAPRLRPPARLTTCTTNC